VNPYQIGTTLIFSTAEVISARNFFNSDKLDCLSFFSWPIEASIGANFFCKFEEYYALLILHIDDRFSLLVCLSPTL
jgi:hypothetical protein